MDSQVSQEASASLDSRQATNLQIEEVEGVEEDEVDEVVEVVVAAAEEEASQEAQRSASSLQCQVAAKEPIACSSIHRAPTIRSLWVHQMASLMVSHRQQLLLSLECQHLQPEAFLVSSQYLRAWWACNHLECHHSQERLEAIEDLVNMERSAINSQLEHVNSITLEIQGGSHPSYQHQEDSQQATFRNLTNNLDSLLWALWVDQQATGSQTMAPVISSAKASATKSSASSSTFSASKESI